jgi:hypothetical protein
MYILLGLKALMHTSLLFGFLFWFGLPRSASAALAN